MPSSRIAAPLAAGLLMIAGVAVAASAADAVKARQAHMKAMGAASKIVFDQLRAGAPDVALIKVQAAKIDAAAKVLPTWFPAGSGPSSGVKTEALPLIWTDAAGFAAKQRALAAAAAKFDEVTQGGDAAAIGPAAKDLGGACKSCHQTYKAKDKA
jgi:cytochrome c556